MRTFLRVAGMSLGHVLAFFYGRADRWWAWTVVLLLFMALHLFAMSGQDPVNFKEHAVSFAEFGLVSLVMLILRRRFWNA
jgi:uncharacterized integral membrane protein